MPSTWPEILAALVARVDLSAAQASWAMDQIMSGEATPVQVAGLLMGLRAKGETVAEIDGFVEQMLGHAVRIEVSGPSLDIVGTGGDRAHTVNISTMAAIVAAAAGVTVVKHGNRAASSSSGSADVLEALGVSLSLPADRVVEVAGRVGMTFCFAQMFHPAMRHAGVARRELGIGTIFNFLGPLTNPAQPTYSAVGVADARMAGLIAGVFAARNRDAAVFRGDDGLDEITITGPSHVWWVRAGEVRELQLDPTDLGVALAPIDNLRGGGPADNAAVVRRVLAGDLGPIRDAVLLNAGLALALTGHDSGTDAAAFHADVRAAMDTAAATIDSGAAQRLLERWVAATNS